MKRAEFYNKLIINDKNYVGELRLNDKELFQHVIKIKTILDKINCLIKLKQYPEEISYYFPGKKGFNTLFFNYDVLVLFLNNKKKIVGTEHLSRNKFSKYYKTSASAIVIQPELIKKWEFKIGSLMDWKK